MPTSRDDSDAIEQLAGAAAKRGDHATAARWWQSLAASDPLSGRIALRLMQAFEAAGHRAAALRHARVHAELLKQELGAPLDAQVAAFAERLTSVAPARSAAGSHHAPVPIAASVTAATDAAVPRATRKLWHRVGFGVAAAAVVAILLVAWFSRRPAAAALGSVALDPKRVAVGIFDNETGDSTLAPLGKMAADWVVRSLARTGVVHVLDAGALYARPSAGSREGALDLARRNGAGLAVAGRFYSEGSDSLVFTAAVFDVASSRVLHTLDPVRAAPNEFVAAHELYWRGHVVEAVAGFRRAAVLDTSSSPQPRG